MDGAIAMDDRLPPIMPASEPTKCEAVSLTGDTNSLTNGDNGNNTVGSRSLSGGSAASSTVPQDEPNDEEPGIVEGDDDGSGAGGLMCGSSFAMGVAPDTNRSPTPLMPTGESPESSVGPVDEDSFIGGSHSPQPTGGAASGLLLPSVSTTSTAPRRSIGGTLPNAPQLPPDVDVINDDIGDILKTAILTTIDDLRRRKARPNLKNISHMMLRRHGCSPRQVEVLLEFLVEREIVIKVDYKGQASYRNASKWKKGHILKGTIMNPAHISRLVLEVIGELEHRLPSQAGVHPDDIEMIVMTRAAQNQWPMNKQKFVEALTREVDLGRLQKLKNGHFRIVEASFQGGPAAAHSNNASGCNIISPLNIQRGPPSMVIPPTNRSSLGSNSAASGSSGTPIKHSPTGFRKSPHDRPNRNSPPKHFNGENPSVGSDAKRQKLCLSESNFNPNMMPQGLGSSGFPMNNMNPAHLPTPSPNLQKLSSLCRFCSLSLSSPSPSFRGLVIGAPSMQGNDRAQDTTLMCATCRFSVHASCAGYSLDQAVRYRETGWMCPSCRTCTFCGFGPCDGVQLIVCDQCDRSYHMNCHIPQLLSPPMKGTRWLCSACDLQPMMSMGPRANNRSAAHVQAQQTGANNKPQQPNHRATPNGSNSSVNGSTGAGDVTPPLQVTNGNIASSSTAAGAGVSQNGNNARLNGQTRTNIAGLPTPSGSGESMDEDISGSQFMPSGPVPPIPAGLPDVIADWSITDVATYFRSAGFTDQARLVSDQEIDGAALLLLKRDDIIHELGFKLGPALKIYQIVAALQRKAIVATSTCLGGANGTESAGAEVLVGTG